MIRLAVRVAREEADVALAELLELAPAGVEEVELSDGRVEYAVYGPPGELPALPDLRALVAGAPVEISTTEVADDWQERWREFHRPVVVQPPPGASVPAVRVRPPWEPPAAAPGAESAPGAEAPPGKRAGTPAGAAPGNEAAPGAERAIEIVIDPGQAFGTGAHASTRLCLGLMLELRAERPGSAAVLDVGTGSGVLAIAAGKLGWGPLLALDNEAESVSAAAENAAVNGVAVEARRFDLRREPLPWVGAGPSLPREEPVIVLANLLAPLLRDLAAAIERPPAELIAGGLLAEQLDEAAARFAPLGLRERARRTADGWGALWLRAG